MPRLISLGSTATSLRFADRRPSGGIAMNAVRRTGFVLGSAFVLTATWASLAFAVSGDLDTSFNGDGKVMSDFTNRFAGAEAVAIQSNGKVVVAGGNGNSGIKGNFAVARYNVDGTLDATFSDNGKVMTGFTVGRDIAYGVAIPADGKIVAAGTAGGAGIKFALARYNANGTLDTTFSGDGKVMTDFTPGLDGAAGVVIQANGKIVAAGTAYADCGCNKFALARYNANGTLDSTFSGDGKVTTYFGFGAHGDAVALQANGKLVVAGSSSELARFALARYRVDGSLDTTFGGDGKVTTRMGHGETAATGVAIQANGKVVAAGYTDVPHEFGDTFGPGKFALARYRVDGGLDVSFGGDGRVTTAFGSRNAAANCVAIQGNGKIAAAGGAGDSSRFALARYNLNGTRDMTFGGDGRVTTNFTPEEDLALGVAVQAGKIVAAGQALVSGSRFAVARYLA
jgi:uncharacterized delta-60 repeat protein